MSMADFRFVIEPHWTELAHCSTLLNGIIGSRHYHVEQYRTTLTIKSVTRGSAMYRTRHGHYRVDEGSFLVLNDGQEYWLDIAGDSKTVTLCPFFQRGFVEHVAQAVSARAEQHLDDPLAQGRPVEFCERLYPKTGAVADHLAQLAQGLKSPGVSAPWLEDQMYALAAELVRLRQQVNGEMGSFPGLRPATRAELYRRLHRARDYLESCFAEPLSVSQVARVACLSPFHFQRMFKQAFRQTPMQYLQARRLHVARRFLETTDQDITSICLEVGFESLGSFSWLFRKQFGVSPRQFRQRLRCGRKEHD